MTESESAPVCQTCGGTRMVRVSDPREWGPLARIGVTRPCTDCASVAIPPFVPERAGDDEASGDEPVTSPDLDHRERLGMRVREVWVAWAREQPNPKPSWLVPWNELSEADKEADRRIGSALWGDGFADGMNAMGEAARAMQSAPIAAPADTKEDKDA